MRAALLVAFAVLMTNCSAAPECSATGPMRCAADRAAASELAGTWIQLRPANGLSVRMTLTARDTIVSGTGTFAAPGGTGATQVSGYVFWRDSVFSPGGIMPAEPITVLNFTFQNGIAARFEQAKLFGQDTLRGVLIFSSDQSTGYGVDFIRTTAQEHPRADGSHPTPPSSVQYRPVKARNSMFTASSDMTIPCGSLPGDVSRRLYSPCVRDSTRHQRAGCHVS